MAKSGAMHTTPESHSPHRFDAWEVVLAVEGDGSDGWVILEDGCRAVPLVDVAVYDSHGHLLHRRCNDTVYLQHSSPAGATRH